MQSKSPTPIQITATVVAVGVSYFSDSTARTRITTDKGEIMFSGVAFFRKSDVISAEGKYVMMPELDQHTRELLADLSPGKSVFRAKEISEETTGVTLRDLAT